MRTSHAALLSAVIFFTLVAVIYFIRQINWQEVKKPVTFSPTAGVAGVATSSAALGQRTKLSGCQSSGVLPDPQCTPGAIFPDVTTQKICSSGYAKSVREVSSSEKEEVYREYGIFSHQSGEYEVDHLISLELGGSNDISNLWPEPATPPPGFHQKDEVENYLHEEVCKGVISLPQAQKEIAKDWFKVYRQISP